VKEWLFDMSHVIKVRFSGYALQQSFLEAIVNDIKEFNQQNLDLDEPFFDVDEILLPSKKEEKFNPLEDIVYEFEVALPNKKWR
jgi:hypothetical protein